MSFWNGVRRAFGLGNDSDEEEEEYDSALPTYAAQPRVSAPVPTVTPVQSITGAHTGSASATALPEHNDEDEAAGDHPAQADAELAGDLFDALIEQFNQAQPEFVRECLSTEAQRAYLFNSLSENLRTRMERALTDCTTSSSRTTGETERLRKRINELETEIETTEALRQENRKLHLSVERQKRALLDRINDLESQVAKYHSEKEKFYTEKHNPADSALIETSTARVKELEQTVADKEKELSERESKIAEHEARIAEMEKSIAERDDTIAGHQSEMAEQVSIREQLEVKIQMSDHMINDLRNQVAAARQEYEDTCTQQQLALEQIHDQVATFEQVKERLENRISELKESLKQEKARNLDEQISRLNEENASLRHTIENNLYNQANSEMKLRNEIKQLKLQLENSNAQSITASPEGTYESKKDARAEESPVSPHQAISPAEPSKSQSKRRGRPKKVKIDDELDNTDWFSHSGGHKDDPDFGYHEPPRRPSNDNAAQLSLF